MYFSGHRSREAGLNYLRELNFLISDSFASGWLEELEEWTLSPLPIRIFLTAFYYHFLCFIRLPSILLQAWVAAINKGLSAMETAMAVNVKIEM